MVGPARAHPYIATSYIKGEEKSIKGQLNFSDKTSRYVVVNQLAS